MSLGAHCQLHSGTALRRQVLLHWLQRKGNLAEAAPRSAQHLCRNAARQQHSAGATFASAAGPSPLQAGAASENFYQAPQQMFDSTSLTEQHASAELSRNTAGRSQKTARSTRWLSEGLSEGTVLHRASSHAHTAGVTHSVSLQPESALFRTVAFYHLVDIPMPEQVVQQHRQYLRNLDIRGRIYVSHQGINAQFSGPTDHALAYAQWVSTQPMFQGLRWNEDPVAEHMFPRLRLAAKPHLVQLAGGMSSLPVTDAQARAREVPPEEWQQLLQAAVLRADGAAGASGQHDGQRPVVLDIRNGYEWDAGHFEGAARPLEDNFVDTPTSTTAGLQPELPEALQGADPATTPVMMYCTGGIRCDIYSTHLRRMGFQNLMTLQGGIQNYLKQTGSDHWRGSLFVFDGRMAVPGDERGELVAAAPCGLCGGQGQLPHSNCAHVDCNRLFISCPACAVRLQGCCSLECLQAPAHLRRPARSPGTYNLYDKLRTLMQQQHQGDSISSDDESGSETEALAALGTRRGPGRTLKRQRRAERIREQHQAVLAERVARKALAKAAMAGQSAGPSMMQA